MRNAKLIGVSLKEYLYGGIIRAGCNKGSETGRAMKS